MSKKPVPDRVFAAEAIANRVIETPANPVFRAHAVAALRLVSESKTEDPSVAKAATRALDAIASGKRQEAPIVEGPDFRSVVWKGPRESILEVQLQKQLSAAAKAPPEEQLKYALEQARLNQERFKASEDVINRLVLRSKGKQAVEIQTSDELKAVAAEPLIFIIPESLRTHSGRLVLNCWPLTLAALERRQAGVSQRAHKSEKPTQGLAGRIGSENDISASRIRDIAGELMKRLILS